MNADIGRKLAQDVLFWIWFVILVVAWIIVVSLIGFARSEAADLEVDPNAGWIWSDDASRALRQQYCCGGLCTVPFMAVPAFLASRIHVAVVESLKRAKEDRRLQRLQEADRMQLERLEARAAAESATASLAHSRLLLTTMLGSIDQFVRVLEFEVDASRRAVALQSIQDVLTSIQSKMATGEIVPDALHDAAIVAQARETCRDLTTLGLASDRVGRDIVRLFALGEHSERG